MKEIEVFITETTTGIIKITEEIVRQFNEDDGENYDFSNLDGEKTENIARYLYDLGEVSWTRNEISNIETPFDLNDSLLRIPFVSIWDGGMEVETSAVVNIKTGEVNAIDKANKYRELDVCEGQYIVMNDQRVYVYENERGYDYWADLKAELS